MYVDEGGERDGTGEICLSDNVIAFCVVQEILEEEGSGLP